MTNEKKPFHEVVARQLTLAVTELVSDPLDATTAEVVTRLLSILQESKMPMFAAHKIADDFAHLPSTFGRAVRYDLSALAEEMLGDLRGRKDEKREEERYMPALVTH